jgi:hypothetical protein
LFCDRKIDKHEVFASLKKLPNGKAPGIDGLPVEFYKRSWPKIGDAYLDLLQECFTFKELPLSMRTSIITLIYKKEDRKQLKNYRPISLLCADYKMVSKAFAERMKVVMHKVVKDDLGPDRARSVLFRATFKTDRARAVFWPKSSPRPIGFDQKIPTVSCANN